MGTQSGKNDEKSEEDREKLPLPKEEKDGLAQLASDANGEKEEKTCDAIQEKDENVSDDKERENASDAIKGKAKASDAALETENMGSPNAIERVANGNGDKIVATDEKLKKEREVEMKQVKDDKVKEDSGSNNVLHSLSKSNDDKAVDLVQNLKQERRDEEGESDTQDSKVAIGILTKDLDVIDTRVKALKEKVDGLMN